jgi:hypothetical protein
MGQHPLTVPVIAELFGLPRGVVRRFLDRHGFTQPKYPGQRRAIPAERLPAVRAAMVEAGFRLPPAA